VVVGGLLMYLAIVKEYEPTLLLPIGFGCVLGNLPVAGYMLGADGLFGVLKRAVSLNSMIVTTCGNCW